MKFIDNYTSLILPIILIRQEIGIIFEMFQDEDSFNAAGLDPVHDLQGGERRLSVGQGDAGDQGDEGDGEQRPGESHHLCVSYSR